MPEYIEREKAYELARTNSLYSDFHRSMADLTSLKELLEDTPTADVVEVGHGEWVQKGYQGIMTHCSECLHRAPFNNHQELILSDYCPNCGAKMDGKGV